MATANPDIQSLRKDMLSLPPSTRALLAQELLESLDVADTGEVDAAWAEEAERRYAEIKSGKVKCIPGDEVLKRVRNRKK